jgi:sulfatase modifying factor 1
MTARAAEGVCPEMVSVPATSFEMGSTEESLDEIESAQHYPRSWFEDETPQHTVEVGPFAIDRFPVTNEQFWRFAESTGYKTLAERREWSLVFDEQYWREIPGASWRHPAGPGSDLDGRDDHPVVQIAWEDAAAFATWAGKRLPTEAEWELAARGPSFRRWPWGDEWQARNAVCAERKSAHPINDLNDWRAWWEEFVSTESSPGTEPVGSCGPEAMSPYGIADAAGNVREWTGSVYELYDPEREYDDLYMHVAGVYRSMRGGGWMDFRYQVRCCERIATDPTYATFAVGFRCAMDVEPQ